MLFTSYKCFKNQGKSRIFFFFLKENFKNKNRIETFFEKSENYGYIKEIMRKQDLKFLNRKPCAN